MAAVAALIAIGAGAATGRGIDRRGRGRGIWASIRMVLLLLLAIGPSIRMKTLVVISTLGTLDLGWRGLGVRVEVVGRVG